MKFIDFQYQHSKYIRKIINSIFDICKKGDVIKVAYLVNKHAVPLT